MNNLLALVLKIAIPLDSQAKLLLRLIHLIKDWGYIWAVCVATFLKT